MEICGNALWLWGILGVFGGSPRDSEMVGLPRGIWRTSEET